MSIDELNILDNPVWSALTTVQADQAIGYGDAIMYSPDVSPFAGLRAQDEKSLNSLREMLSPGESVLLVGKTNTFPELAGLSLQPLFKIQQMVDTRSSVGYPRAQINELSFKDVPEMVKLAQDTQPGPFGPRTIEMGKYIGVRRDGCLVAMAGERFRVNGFTEISAVCVNEEYRGQGIASDMINLLRQQISGREETPFLHVRDDSQATITLYKRLGFSTRDIFQIYRIYREL
ncbi:GNAT family N-acetyltransferase [Phytobacter ursingii]|uniref:GNAT family N-acetyltransferase n=1 Tax=Phytobacter ursingii TaxID=1972431 RepID=UPI000CD1DB11|nr:GNAT family N-acetyltransferase [Enterobacteriaceae bacterium ENNIH1]